MFQSCFDDVAVGQFIATAQGMTVVQRDAVAPAQDVYGVLGLGALGHELQPVALALQALACGAVQPVGEGVYALGLPFAGQGKEGRDAVGELLEPHLLIGEMALGDTADALAGADEGGIDLAQMVYEEGGCRCGRLHPHI